MLCRFVAVVPWQPLRILLASVVQRGMNIAQTDWQWLYSFFAAYLEARSVREVQDGGMEQSTRWIKRNNCCHLSFFYICGDGVEEHQHIRTSGVFKCRLALCLRSTEVRICTLEGLKVKHFTPDRKTVCDVAHVDVEIMSHRTRHCTKQQLSRCYSAVLRYSRSTASTDVPLICCSGVHTSTGLVHSLSVTMTNKPTSHGNRPRPEAAQGQEALLFLISSVKVEHIAHTSGNNGAAEVKGV